MARVFGAAGAGAGLVAVAALSLGGCASGRDETPPVSASEAADAEPPAGFIDWRRIATANDRQRVRHWRDAWVQALRQAREAGHGAEIDREGALLSPDAAVDWRDPPPGEYRCRVTKIGAKQSGLLDYVAYPYFRCRIRMEEGLMSFAKLTGSQRQIGMLLPFGAQQRMIFLGTMQLGDEDRAQEYGRDRDRDLVGVVERIEDNRWRIAFPYPHFESLTDVLELVPA